MIAQNKQLKEEREVLLLPSALEGSTGRNNARDDKLSVTGSELGLKHDINDRRALLVGQRVGVPI